MTVPAIPMISRAPVSTSVKMRVLIVVIRSVLLVSEGLNGK
jgi:hypothetical protein